MQQYLSSQLTPDSRDFFDFLSAILRSRESCSVQSSSPSIDDSLQHAGHVAFTSQARQPRTFRKYPRLSDEMVAFFEPLSDALARDRVVRKPSIGQERKQHLTASLVAKHRYNTSDHSNDLMSISLDTTTPFEAC